MERQWKRAETLVNKSESGKRAKFLREEGGRYLLNDDLKRKTELLLGLRGYHTNIPETILLYAPIDLYPILEEWKKTRVK